MLKPIEKLEQIILEELEKQCERDIHEQNRNAGLLKCLGYIYQIKNETEAQYENDVD